GLAGAGGIPAAGATGRDTAGRGGAGGAAGRGGPCVIRGGANGPAGWRDGREGVGGDVGRSSGRNGTIFGSGFGGAAGPAAAAAGLTGSAGSGGAGGATREGSGAISGGLARMTGASPVISAGFGLTIVAAGLTSAGTSSAASAGLPFLPP